MSRSNHEVMSYPKSQAPLGTDRSTDRRRERSTNGIRAALFFSQQHLHTLSILRSDGPSHEKPLVGRRPEPTSIRRFPPLSLHRQSSSSRRVAGTHARSRYGIAARREKLFPDPKRPMTEPQRLTLFPEDRTEQRAPSMQTEAFPIRRAEAIRDRITAERCSITMGKVRAEFSSGKRRTTGFRTTENRHNPLHGSGIYRPVKPRERTPRIRTGISEHPLAPVVRSVTRPPYSARKPASQGRPGREAAATARRSQRSFSGISACPLTHTKRTLWRRYTRKKRCQRSGFFLSRNPLRSQPNTHPFSTASTT